MQHAPKQPVCLSSLPEELLLRILSLCLTLPTVLPPKSIHSLSPSPELRLHQLKPGRSRGRVAPIYVCQQFYRIGLPLFYHTLYLQSASDVASALEILKQRPSLAHAVRTMVFSRIWKGCSRLLILCGRVDSVDLCLNDGAVDDPESGAEVQLFFTALESRAVIHMTIRKDPTVYLTHPRPRYLLERLAQTIHQLPTLECIHIAFRLSSSPTTLQLAHALSVAPRLRTVRSQLPAVWNNILLSVSSNMSLQKISLYSASGHATQIKCPSSLCADTNETDIAILGTAIYIMEARKHARLLELIKAGTSFVRTRAHTIIATSSNRFGGSATPLPFSRVKKLATMLLTEQS